MKVFIPDIEGFISGPKTFLTNLKTYLENKVTFAEDPLKSDIIFFPAAYDLEVLKKAKSKGIKIVQRLDGIYYPQKHEDYEEKNRDILNIYSNYADYVVFQSDYSRKQCFELFGKKEEDKYTLIINGVNKEIFTPNPTKHFSKKIEFISTGNFRNIDMIEPIVLALDNLTGRFDFELNIVGTVRNPDIEHFFSRPYINMIGELSLEDVASHLRSSDIFLFSHLNPPCPNSVIEAISAALPIVSFDSGSMSELVFFAKELLADVSDNTFQTYSQFKFEKLYEKILLSINEFDKYKELALNNSTLYSFEVCGESYLNVFRNVTKNTGLFRRFLSKL